LLKVIITPETPVPEEFNTLPDTDRTGCVLPACVTLTSWGLSVALVTRMVAVRAEAPVLAVKLQLMVPELVPLAPDVIDNQLPDVTDAFHVTVPVPV
jgi:hypothetical protein